MSYCRPITSDKFKASKGVVTNVDRNLRKRIKHYNYMIDRIMTVKFKYEK